MMAGGLKSNVTGHIQFKSTRTFYYSIAPDLLLFYFSTTITVCVCVCVCVSTSVTVKTMIRMSSPQVSGSEGHL